MSQENVEVVRRVLSAVAAGDRERAPKLVAPEIVVDATRNAINPGTYEGLDGLRQWQADMDDVWQDIRLEPVELIDGGDRVVVVSHLISRGKGSGVAVERLSSAQVATVHDGRIIRWEIGYTNRAEALEAAGLSE